MLQFRDGLDEMPVYDVTERDWKIKINANESSLNLPPLVEERVLSRLSRIAFNRYPNDEGGQLCEQIAADLHLKKENICLGNGSSEIIEKLCYAFGGSGHTIVYPEPSFSMYRIYVEMAGAEGAAVPTKKDYRLDVKNFVATAKDRQASLAILCNPNNPTGNFLPLHDVAYLAHHLDCAFLVDEAYIEFGGSSAISLMKRFPNVIVARTFSKAFGLASARVGYMIAAPEIVRMVNRVYMPYHMNVLSLATADIVYQMRDEYAPRIAMTISERQRLEKQLKELPGITVYPSRTNFLLVKCDRATALNEALAGQGIGVRSFGNAPGLVNCLRISIGTREENDTWFKAIQDFMEGRS